MSDTPYAPDPQEPPTRRSRRDKQRRAPSAPATRRALKEARRSTLIGSGAVAMVLALVLGVMTFSSIRPQGAEAADPPITATLVKPGETGALFTGVDASGRTITTDDSRSFQLFLSYNGVDYRAYCIDFHTPSTADMVYTQSSTAPTSLSRLQWIVQHSNPTLSLDRTLLQAGIDPTQYPELNKYSIVIGATQAALWHFSDGITVNQFVSPTYGADTMKLYQWFLANAGTGAPATASPTITTAGATYTNGTYGPITVTTGDGSAAQVAVSPTAQLRYLDGTAVSTGAVVSGKPFEIVDAPAGGTYTITATGTGQVAAGQVFTTPGGQDLILADDIVTTTSTETTTVGWDAPAPVLVPQITVDKTADRTTVTPADGLVTYQYAVTAPGTDALRNVTLSDDVCTATAPVLAANGRNTGDSNADDILQPGETWRYTCRQTLTATTTNTATATGTGVTTGTAVHDTDTWTVTLEQQAAAIELVKTAGAVTDLDGNGPDAGDTLTFGFTVTNTGGQTLTEVAVSDPQLGAVTCAATTLAPGAQTTCTAPAYTLTPADIDAGEVTNTASATGKPEYGPTPTDTSTVTKDVTAPGAVQLVKSVASVADTNGNGRNDAGDVVTYSLVAKNTGNVTLTGVTVSDPMLGAVTCTSTTLAPGASTTCTAASHTITAAEAAAGSLRNVATVTGTPPTGPDVTSTDDAVVPTGTAGITLDKTAGAVNDLDGNGPDAGDTIAYTFVVTNTGTSALTRVEVTDVKIPTLSCPATTLAARASMTCTGTYTLTAADVAAGSVANSADVTGTPGTGTPVDGTDYTSTPAVPTADAISLTKTASTIADANHDGMDSAGDTMTFTFVVTNTGLVPLTDVTLSDPKLAAANVAISCPKTTLAAGEPMTCTSGTYTVTPADMAAGAVRNTADVVGTAPNGERPTADAGSTTPVAQKPTLTLDKSADAVVDLDKNGPDAGDTITFRFLVTNNGNVAVSGIGISDVMLEEANVAITCPAAGLAPATSMTCTSAPYTITAADVARGSINNTATVNGTSTTPDGDDTSTPVVPTQTGISLVKTGSAITDADKNGLDSVGDTMTFTLVVTNAGQVPLTDVHVDDPKLAAAGLDVNCPKTTLAVKESMTCTTGTYRLTAQDVAAGAVVNHATATGTAPNGDKPTAPATSTTPVKGVPGIDLDKRADGVKDLDSNGPDAGDTVTFSFVVTNTGNIALTGISISDLPLESANVAISCPTTQLGAGETMTCVSAPYTLTAADAKAGKVSNTATVVSDQTKDGDSDTVTQPIVPGPCASATSAASGSTPTTADGASTGTGSTSADGCAPPPPANPCARATMTGPDGQETPAPLPAGCSTPPPAPAPQAPVPPLAQTSRSPLATTGVPVSAIAGAALLAMGVGLMLLGMRPRRR